MHFPQRGECLVVKRSAKQVAKQTIQRAQGHEPPLVGERVALIVSYACEFHLPSSALRSYLAKLRHELTLHGNNVDRELALQSRVGAGREPLQIKLLMDSVCVDGLFANDE
jgi:hypothetical protein